MTSRSGFASGIQRTRRQRISHLRKQTRKSHGSGPVEVRKELPPYSGDVRGGCVRAAARRQVAVIRKGIVRIRLADRLTLTPP